MPDELAKFLEKIWDTTTDPANPQPLVWAECSDESCRTPYVWRRFFRLTGGYVWAWSPDCKHDRRKPRPPAVLMTKDGPISPAGTEEVAE